MVAYRQIGLVGKYQSPDVADVLSQIIKFLLANNVSITVEQATAAVVAEQLTKDLLFTVGSFAQMGETCELVIVVGGDGTMLHAARQLSCYQVPLLGVNQGRLGFLTDIAHDQVIEKLCLLLLGNFKLEQRMLLSAEVIADGKTVYQGIACNDVVLTKGGGGRLIEQRLFINDEFVFNLRADGLIVSTPTGSTAYALSAGGPIIMPPISVISIVPLCAHALSNRPLLVSDNDTIRVELVRTVDAYVHFDGQHTEKIQNGTTVLIKKNPSPIQFLHPPDYRYFSMLREKLNWSEPLQGLEE